MSVKDEHPDFNYCEEYFDIALERGTAIMGALAPLARALARMGFNPALCPIDEDDLQDVAHILDRAAAMRAECERAGLDAPRDPVWQAARANWAGAKEEAKQSALFGQSKERQP